MDTADAVRHLKLHANESRLKIRGLLGQRERSVGELAEFFSVYDWGQTIDQYNKRIYDKTASLFCTASESGAVLAGAPEPASEALRDYGYNLGMAFQIMDDVLDFMGTEEELGKPAAHDLTEGIYNLPVLRALQTDAGDVHCRRLRGGDVLRIDGENCRSHGVTDKQNAICCKGQRSR